MAARLNTTQYQWTHLRKPAGRGWWWLKVMVGDFHNAQVQHYGTLTEAVKHAKRLYREATEIVVCP